MVKRTSSRHPKSMALLASASLTVVLACKPKPSSEATDQSADGGLAQHVFYQCTTATMSSANKTTFSTSTFNNFKPEISVQIDASNSKTLEFSELSKDGTDRWVSKSGLTLTLISKKDGAKGIRLEQKNKGLNVGVENSFCQTLCTGPTKLAEGRCIWTGVTEESVIGNMLIETLASAGLGTVWRVATIGRLSTSAAEKTARAVLVLDSPFRTGAQNIAKSKTFEEAIEQMSKAIQKTNPLSGTPAVGGGNCANDAMTQLVSLVLGRWACAIPYPKGQLPYATAQKILEDLNRLVGIKSSQTGIERIGEFAKSTLVNKMDEGEFAFLLSTAPKAGHATLITKVKGQLVHINNQNWSERFQTVEQWERTWRSTYGRDGARFEVYIVSKKMLGFN